MKITAPSKSPKKNHKKKIIAKPVVAKILKKGSKRVLFPDLQIGSQEERLRRMATVIQDSNDAITIQDLDGRILAWNRGAEKIYGYSESEALQKNIVDTVPESHQSEALNFIAALRLGEVVPVLETKRKTKDGRIIDVWLTNTKLVDDQGKLTGVATTGRDITERKHAEASLREKARELEFLREGQITLSDKMRGEQDIARLGQSVLNHLAPFLNAQMGAFYCLTEEKVLKHVSGYAYSQIREKDKTIELGEGLVGQAALGKSPILLDQVPSDYFGTIGSDLGGSAPRSLLFAPVFYDGEVNGVIELASFAPFSEHQKTFLEHVSENIGIAINTSMSRKKLQKLLETSQILTEKLQDQQEELTTVNEDLESQSRELNDKNDALNKAQKLLQERSDEVQRASQYKSEFLANMSHELRTPLNSSLILAKLLSDNTSGNLTREQIQYANSIHSAGNDLLNLINDILDLSKVEAGKLEIRVENVFLPKVFHYLEKTFEPVAKEKRLAFKITVASDLPETIFTDRQRVEQILKNLLSNAFKFTERGQITLHAARSDDGRISLSVTDTGIGVKKEQHEVIFEAFSQADGTTNRKYGGTGLGLSISRDLARLLGGSVEVESVPDRGSCFTLFLPDVYDESRIQVASPKTYSLSAAVNTNPNAVKPRVERLKPVPFADDRSLPVTRERTLLVIEDDIRFAQILFDLAHEHEYRCVVAQTAEEGLELAKTLTPSAIWLDIKLPDRSGLTVLDQLKENQGTRHIPVQIASDYDYAEKALEMGAVGYAIKPVTRVQLNAGFAKIHDKLTQKIKHVLVVEDDQIQRDSIVKLISGEGIEITAVELGAEALKALETKVFDCMVIDLKLPDMSGEQLLKKMTEKNENLLTPPVIVYTGRSLSHEEEAVLRKYSRSIIIKGAKSPARLFDEVGLFLHSRRPMQSPRHNEDVFDGRKVLLVDDDVRNIFALTAALEEKGAQIVFARNGIEALARLKDHPRVDLVLMDIMMPEMDGYEATRQIRKEKRFSRLPIIAVTAKATKVDQELCLEAGANDYLAKPIDLHQLISLIRVWLPKLGRD